MRTVIAAAAAAGLLVGAAFTATMISSSDASAQEVPTPEEPGIQEEAAPHRGAGFLRSVLDELVADGVLTEAQASAVVDALQEKAEEFEGQRPFRRGFRHGLRSGVRIREMLEDGVIDADELASLPDGHPLTDPDGPAAAFLEDGQITQDELAELREAHRAARGADVPGGTDA